MSLMPDQTKYLKIISIFNKFDVNGNGYLSFSEVEKGIKEILKYTEKTMKKEVVKLAYNFVKDSGYKRTKVSHDFVEKNEFRTFLFCLKQFAEYYDMFHMIEKEENNKITFEEFKNTIPLMNKWGIEVENPKKLFDEIDSNSGGQIMFGEFCFWAIRNNVDLEDGGVNYDHEELDKILASC